MKSVFVAAIMVLSTSVSGAGASDQASASYAGWQVRDIKSLSNADIKELSNGGGWGFALTAELNGWPGPRHLLEHRAALELTEDQVQRIETIFQAMRAEAIEAGKRFIAAEAQLSDAFAGRDLDPDRLWDLVSAAAKARAALRHTHLSRHLEVTVLLTPRQIERYSIIRGYAAGRCDAVPEGHDPDMWRRHHQCD
ncbi:MAG: periplasmic heavy metal sensor [Pseudomonadota bacterium]